MLKKILNIFSTTKNGSPDQGPHTYGPGQHSLAPTAISSGAREVVTTLKTAGFDAFLVGGCVRDMLLKLHPKDFDVATNATPEEVNRLFRRSRIIGRRFRIVHVMTGRETIEVTTFRASHSEGDQRTAVQSDSGLLLRDNVFGEIDEDARRRDFTVNALYYDPEINTVYDYANGVNDINRRQLVIIGDPETRYREDPVRMLRAARFAAKLGFTISPASSTPIPGLASLLADVAPARLFDEFLKLFLSGYALATFNQLKQYGLAGELFPDAMACTEADDSGFYLEFVEQAMTNTDKRIRNNQRVTPAFLLAALLWPAVNQSRLRFEAKGENPAMALQKAGGQVIAQQVSRIAIPRRFSMPMREIWELQMRLANRTGTRAAHLVSLPRFRAAYDFVLLREQAGEDLGGLGHWWTRYQEADEKGRRTLVESLGSGSKRRRKRRPRKRAKPDDTSGQ
jgi:poly(A) polymerase